MADHGHESDEELTLVVELSSGGAPLGPSLEVDADHPLTGGLRQILAEGKPGSVSRFLVLESGDDRRLLGTVSHTVGDRLLFGPAAYVQVSTGDPRSRFEGATLDHLTLDAPGKGGRHLSHIAVRDLPAEHSRGLGWTTVPPPGHKVPWFSLLLPEIGELPVLPGRLLIHIPRRWSDLGAYGEKVIGSIGGLDRIPLPVPSSLPSFVQLDFWAGRGRDWRRLQHRPLPWAYKQEIVSDAPAGEQQITVSEATIGLSDGIGVTILAARPAGRLGGAHVLRPRLSR